MATPTIDLRAPSVTIKFNKGKTLKPVFFYLSPHNAVINLTGYKARMFVYLNDEATTPIWELTTENNGLVITQGTAELADGTQIANAYGVKPQITATQTSAVTWTSAQFYIELIEPGNDVLPFLMGTLTPAIEKHQ